MSSLSLTLKGAFQQPVVLLQGLVLPAILLALWQYNSGLGSSHAYAFVPLQNIYSASLQLLETGELWVNTWGSLKKAGLGFYLVQQLDSFIRPYSPIQKFLMRSFRHCLTVYDKFHSSV